MPVNARCNSPNPVEQFDTFFYGVLWKLEDYLLTVELLLSEEATFHLSQCMLTDKTFREGSIDMQWLNVEGKISCLVCVCVLLLLLLVFFFFFFFYYEQSVFGPFSFFRKHCDWCSVSRQVEAVPLTGYGKTVSYGMLFQQEGSVSPTWSLCTLWLVGSNVLKKINGHVRPYCLVSLFSGPQATWFLLVGIRKEYVLCSIVVHHLTDLARRIGAASTTVTNLNITQAEGLNLNTDICVLLLMGSSLNAY
jgi:hypothetical protein